MQERSRMTGEERKKAIIDVAKPLFAEKGFNGTSMSTIAKAGNMSQALIYRHFDSKEALYKEINKYVSDALSLGLEKIRSSAPGTERIVHMVYLTLYMILFEMPKRAEEQKVHERLLFNSLLEDGVYAKYALKVIMDSCLDVLNTSFAISIQQGDIINTGRSIINNVWFVHLLAMGINLCNLTKESVIDYEGDKRTLIEDAILFSLRGIGMTEEAITKYTKSDTIQGSLARMFDI